MRSTASCRPNPNRLDLMRRRPPGKVIVEAEVAAGPLVATLKSRLPASAFHLVERIPDRQVYDPDVLEVVAFRGRLLKSCPGTRHYFCCGYRILHFGVQCSLSCSYCILQAYLNQPNLRLFGNTEGIFAALGEELHSYPDRLYRIGTGEFTDSLLLDPWTGLSRQLVPFFARQPHAVLELKTKTDCIDNLADLPHNGHTIVAWSLNAESIRSGEESRAASIGQRLAAAKRCADWGYWLAFHFDPLLEHPHWEETYRQVVARLFDQIDPTRVVWISLGAFRFMPELKPIIQQRHPRSRIVYGEFIRGLDGKMRYFRDIRVGLYRVMADAIRQAAPEVCLYLCMESEDMWRAALGFSPEDRGGLPAMLDEAVRQRMRIGICRSHDASRSCGNDV
ncbi:MAG TPA: DNA photolyase [Syntrophobacteraceae bacterium]|nr:DNA photolyase [Syntrophobacteraceae bacterium]